MNRGKKRLLVICISMCAVLALLLPGCSQAPPEPVPTPTPPPTLTPPPTPTPEPTPAPTPGPTPSPEPEPQPPTSPSQGAISAPQKTVLNFETISISNSFIESYPKDPRIEVITSVSDTPIKGISPKDQEKINAVNFSRNFVLIAFHGWTYPGSGIRIQRISQYKWMVWVSALFQEPQETTGTEVTTPYHIVQVSKEQMTQFGEIEFRLFQDGRSEKDFVTGIITSFPPEPGEPKAATLPPGTDLIFDNVAINDFPSVEEGQRSPNIQLITSKPVSAITGISRFDQPKIESVDFSKYFVVVAFIGHSTPSYNIRIRRVWQDKDVVYLLFHARPPQQGTIPAYIFPYHVVKISKEQMSQHGKITFKLLDQHGKEWAKTTHEISQ